MVAAKKPRKKKPRAIVVDFDDTVVNFLDTLCLLHNKRHGTSITTNDLTSWNFEDIEIEDARGNIVRGEELYQTMQTYEPHGLYAILQISDEALFALQLIKKLDYHIIVLTARPEKYKLQTELNMTLRNVPCDTLIFDTDKVKQINKLKRKFNVTFFVDDNLKTVNSVAEECDLPYTFLINKRHNTDIEVNEYVTVVDDLLETVRYLK